MINCMYKQKTHCIYLVCNGFHFKMVVSTDKKSNPHHLKSALSALFALKNHIKIEEQPLKLNALCNSSHQLANQEEKGH